MVTPGIDQANGPPLPFPGQQAGGGRVNGHRSSSPASTATAVANGGGEQRMRSLNHTVASVAGDLEGMVHVWDRTRSAMDTSVDENLRALSYSVAKGRVLGKIVDMGATIVDDPKQHRRGRRPRSTPPAPHSPPSLSRSPSPSRSRGSSSTAGGALAVTGFDLQAALESNDIVQVKEHLRSLHDLAAEQELMLEEMNTEGMDAVELNHKLSLKLLDKSKELEMVKKAYFLAIEDDPSPAVPDSNGGAPHTAAAAAVASPALEPVSSGMTPPPLPRPPRSDSAAAERREHSRAYSGVGIMGSTEGGGGGGGWGSGAAAAAAAGAPAGAQAAANGGGHREERGRARTRTGSGVSVGSSASVRAELFPPAEDIQQQQQPEALSEDHSDGHSMQLPLPPPPTAFSPRRPPPVGTATAAGQGGGRPYGDAPPLGPFGSTHTTARGGVHGGASTPAAGSAATSPRSSHPSPARGGATLAPPVMSGPPVGGTMGLAPPMVSGPPVGGLMGPPMASSSEDTPKPSAAAGSVAGGGQGGERHLDDDGSGGAFEGPDRGLAVSSPGGSLPGSAATTPRKHPFQNQLGAGAAQGLAPPPPKMSGPPPPTMSGPPPGAAGGWMAEGGGSGGDADGSGAVGGPDQGISGGEDPLQAMMMPPPRQALQHRPPPPDLDTGNSADKAGAPPLAPPPVLPHPGQQISFRAPRKTPAAGVGGAGFGGPPPKGFGGATGPFGGGAVAGPFGGGGTALPFGGPANGSSSSHDGDGSNADGREIASEGGGAAGATATQGGDGGTTASNVTGGEKSGTSYSSAGSFNGSFGSGRGGGGGGTGADPGVAPEAAAQQPPSLQANGGDDYGGSGAAINGDIGQATAAMGYPEGVLEAEPNGGSGGFGSSPWPEEDEGTKAYFGGV